VAKARKTDAHGNKEPNVAVGVTRVVVHNARHLAAKAVGKVKGK
jgi:hypothetical protein